MFRRYRQRRGPYAMAEPSPMPSVIRSLVLLAVGLLLLWFVGSWILRLFGGGNQVQRSAVTMQVENGGTVNVSLEGGLMQRAEDSLKLYPGDRVNTGGNGHAVLSFFDGTRIRLDGQSDLSIEESEAGSDESEMETELTTGTIWMRTPDLATFSGSIVRTVVTPGFRLEIPSDAEVVIGLRSLIVFSADGQGVLVDASGADAEVWIGEGQQIDIPTDVSGDILTYRKAIEPLAVQSAFIEETRMMSIGTLIGGSGSGAIVEVEDEALIVTTPSDKTVVTTSTVKVEGTVGRLVDRVRVNGYQAVIDESNNSFSQELAVEEGEETTITVEALDVRGVSIAKIIRTVTRGSRIVEKPGITFPAGDGQSYRTQANEIEIRGTAPAGVAGIMVNDYRLQLFRTGDTTWSYLASVALSNLKAGSNVFDIFALDANGNRSEPARITILVEDGTVGVVGGTAPSTSSAASSINPATLPNNAPLLPGTITVTGPTAGTAHTATGSEFLLEGTTPSATASVWVNDYRLQLYKQGATFWNYIAKVEYQTLKVGTNTYRIVARNANNEILDTFEYTVTYNP